MDISKLSQDVSVTGQLTPKDMALVKSLGFASVVCNRPDGESPDQPLFESIASAGAFSSRHADSPATTKAAVRPEATIMCTKR